MRAIALSALALTTASCTLPPSPVALAPLGLLFAVALLGRAIDPRPRSPSQCTFPVLRRV